MACSAEDPQTNFKHFCRICKKGFMCGRALGGHMRAHGIGDDSGGLDDEDMASDWEDKQGSKRMYSLRTNPNRLKSCRVCENCGKEFLSWKSFLEHGKCSSDDAESLVSSPESEELAELAEDDQGRRDREYGGRGGGGWSKRKRSFRAKVGSFNSMCPSSEEEDLTLAKCLMALSNARVDPFDAEPEESCASASRDQEHRRNPNFATTAFLSPPFSSRIPPLDHKAKGVAGKGMFECKACKKVFNSHQALGGHRASHKKVKGCFAARNDHYEDSLGADDDVITHEEFFPSTKSPSSNYQFDQGPSTAPPLVGAARRKSKVHKCSICNRIFASGQALGGHKRCHWLTSNSPVHDASSLSKLTSFHDHIEQLHQRVPTNPGPSPMINKSSDPALDLNLPAPGHDVLLGLRRDPRNPLSFEVSTEINLHTWVDADGDTKIEDTTTTLTPTPPNKHQISNNNVNMDHDVRDSKITTTSNHEKNSNNVAVLEETVDDEADSKVKLAKLSELKEMNNITGNSSSWLQVGIGSTTAETVAADP